MRQWRWLIIVLSLPGVGSASGQDTPPADPPLAEAPVRAVYLPPAVRAELLETLRKEVLDTARQEGWAAPGAVPAWVKRFLIAADLRLRWDMIFFQPGNARTGEFPDFNAINQGEPFDVLGFDLANDRYINTDQNRQRLRIQARLGTLVQLDPGLFIELRLASGDGSTPVSTNQTLGGEPGNFSKYQLWIDRAAIRFDPLAGQPSGASVELGRMMNPFFHTELPWDEDVSFDGVTVRGWVGTPTFTVQLTGGAFPLLNTPPDFPLEQTAKVPSFDKWLFAGQLSVSGTIPKVLTARLAGGYYYFHNIEGRLSSPCDTNLRGFSCNTDISRPAFSQKGNTFKSLRTPSLAALTAEATGFAPEYQFFGLSSLFRELIVAGRVDLFAVRPLRVVVEGELAYNFGFNPGRFDTALNNLGPCNADGVCPFAGGPAAYQGRITVGSAELFRQWSWDVSVSYRWVASDALLDAYTDSDFGQGGTNLKGYILQGNLWVTNFLLVTARWMSATQVSGPPYAVDVLHIDLTARTP